MPEAKSPAQLIAAARSAQDLREHLASLPHEELVQLCLHVVNTYVLEGVTALTRGGSAPTTLAEDTHGEETFAGLLRRLKQERRDPVLDKFLVEGEHISVRIGNDILPLTDYARGRPASGAPVARGLTANVRPMQPGVSFQERTSAPMPSAPQPPAHQGGFPRDPFGGPAAPRPPEPARRPASGAPEHKGDVPPPGGPRLIEMD